MTPPALSVILIASSDFAHIQKTVRHLRAQTRVSEVELVLAVSDPDALKCDPAEWQGFHSVHCVPVGPITSGSVPKVQVFSYAGAPVIAFIEDHVFPAPNWAHALIEAHRQPYAAVSVEMWNSNPSSVSRADMMLSFGQWLAPAVSGPKPMLPGHNTSYKREIITPYGDAFAAMLDSEAVLHAQLTLRGETLYLSAESSIGHLNISQWRPFYRHAFLGGRIFGGTRGSRNNWGIFKRALYALGVPLIPLVRLKRMWPDLRRTGALDALDLTFWFAIVSGLLTHAAGEATGYLFGTGDAVAHYTPIELHRADQLRVDEQHLAFE